MNKNRLTRKSPTNYRSVYGKMEKFISMSKIQNKRLLKKIAQDWCKSILLANGMDSFDEGLLTQDEQAYVVQECHKIAESLSDRTTLFTLPEIIKQYYIIE